MPQPPTSTTPEEDGSTSRRGGLLARLTTPRASGGLLEQARARVMDRLAHRTERVLDLLERSAQLELRLLERLAPIVDNLGELVKLQLDEARRRAGRPTGDAEIIDVEHEEG